ncbi:periplasmic binding protein [Afipia carboxidovorans OM5]|uniref:ABC transporter substrate-binding protein n=1 Tax=Afipia carboxidovorans (strain ATCC 49405 / DSM 1227 / KCTC 32145 / OM5) TaxID=504832 RepID=B6JJU6_AFIC5|nr:ABC transporter substrate-binding protein [Afipia carboxidovorans]ACI94690.1 periplasmic binding protein [Afipia carboxidovorans OM5]AEI01703.1 ABC transporter substrate-binding protein [Afipia carboxidovorans OM4]AEI05278.1 ABC transporter substrate-binding protein [Afipia carboxidovorans OM5]
MTVKGQGMDVRIAPRWKAAIGAMFALMLVVGDASAVEPPRRIVSFNLCADQLLLALADPSQIAALSPYATDASLSVTTEQAAAFPKIDWNSESVVNLAPDLVLSGFTDRPTQAILAAAGLRVVQVALVRNIDEARAQVRELGVLLGHPERGAALASKLKHAEDDLAAVALKPPRTAIVLQREGYTEGTESLVAAMLAVAGLTPPPNARGGIGGFMDMETLLTAGPDVLVLQEPASGATDQGALFLTHPALRARYDETRRIHLPSRDTLCGGPALLEGLGVLKYELQKLR